MKRIALLGNPNCGKTTLFNRLTGSMHHTGNWAGVTVDVRSGVLKGEDPLELVDLPGLYSLDPATPEQRVAEDFLRTDQADLYVDVVDATNLERNLLLTLQLMETGAPLLVAVNMMDDAERLGFRLDLGAMSKALGVPVLPVSAVTGEGVDALVRAMRTTDAGRAPRGVMPWFQNREAVFPAKPAEQTAIMPSDDPEMSLRYAWIESLCTQTLHRNDEGLARVGRVDRVLLHAVFGIPIFLLLMMILFFAVFGPPGSWLAHGMQALLAMLQQVAGKALVGASAAEWLVRLVVEGILGGVGSVLVFLPQFALLFLGLAILEDSGYMARAAFLMDRFMRRFGLSGKAFIPMLVGFGCNVPAILSTRTLQSERERRLAVFLLPFMSCGARMPLYALLAAAFFGQIAGLVVFGMYLGGIGAAVLTGTILRKTLLRGEPQPFIIELPPYRMPTLRSLWAHLSERIGDYLRKAGTLLFAASVIVWFLQAFSPSLVMVSDPAQSLFAVIGRFVAPIFVPAGYGDWRVSVALLTGFTAKEAVLSTLGVLLGDGGLSAGLKQLLTPASALALMVFSLLYTPCMATLAAMHKEFRSFRWRLGAVAWQLVLAWTASVAVFQLGRLIGL